jgi:DNA-binding MarR family transcriptional regulator
MSALGAGIAPPEPHLGDVLEFMRLLWRVDHALQRRSKRMEQLLGVTAPQRLVLLIVGRFPGIPAGHLASLLHLHPSTLTGVVRRLERQRLLRRRIDPKDARRALLTLTGEGRRINSASEGTVESAVHHALSRTSARDLEAARVVLTALAASLDPADDIQESVL